MMSGLFATARRLVKEPLYSGGVVVALAVGIAAGAVSLSMFAPVIFLQLPFPDSDRVVMVWRTDTKLGNNRIPLTFDDVRQWEALSANPWLAVGAYKFDQVAITSGGSRRVRAARVTPGLSHAWGVRPQWGRAFDNADSESAARRAVLISRWFADATFGDSSEAVGARLAIDGRQYDVVGVLGDQWAFGGFQSVAVWLPSSDADHAAKGQWYVSALLRSPSDIPTVQTLLAQLPDAQSADSADGKRSVRVEPMSKALVGPQATLLAVLVIGAVVSLLLVACANASNLIYARTSARVVEFSVRMAMGASRWKIALEVIREGVVLTFAAGVTALILLWFTRASVRAAWSGQSSPFNWWVLAGAGVLALVAVVFSSLVPALAASKLQPVDGLRVGGAMRGMNRRTGMRATLVIGQLALSATLVVVGGVIVNAVIQARNIPLGFDTTTLLTLRAVPQTRDRLTAALAAVAAEPGVTAVAAADALPVLTAPIVRSVRLQRPNSEITASADIFQVSDRFFETLEIPVIAGPPDFRPQPGVVAVSKAFADQHRAVIGDSIVDPASKVSASIGAIVGNTRGRSSQGLPSPVIYYELSSFNQRDEIILVVRTSSDPSFMAEAVAARTRVGLGLPSGVSDVVSAQQVVTELRRDSNTVVLLMVALAVVGGVLAVLGIFSLVAWDVAGRSREASIRSAIGGRPLQIVMPLMRRYLFIVAAGVGFGSLAGTGIGRVLSAQSSEIPAMSVSWTGLAAVVLLGVGALAAYIPMTRILRVDPAEALRAN